jgi:hypothetical protein
MRSTFGYGMADTVATTLVPIKSGSQMRGLVALAHDHDMVWPASATR